MLELFKRKRDEIPFPKDYIDIHSHILPGIDDGAPNVETALHLLDNMWNLGVRQFVFTPHVMEGVWENSTERINNTLEILKGKLDGRKFEGITLRAAAEYMMDDGFLGRLKKKDLLPISGNLVLVEMSFVSPPLHLYQTLADIQVAGYRPLLAHPERYFFLHNDLEGYEKLRSAGCLFQLNMLALSNYYGKDVKKMALRLLNKGYYDFVGSDLHHDRHFQNIQKLTGKKEFWKRMDPLVKNNKVLAG